MCMTRGSLCAIGVGSAAILILVWRRRRLTKKRPKLILHFDVNETILIGDPAGGDTFEDCLNKLICKSAFVCAKSGRVCDALSATSLDDVLWWNGAPMDDPSSASCRNGQPIFASLPALLTGADAWTWPEGCVPFYKIEGLKARFAKRFTEPDSPGCIYRGKYEELERTMRLPPGSHVDSALVGKDGVHHALVPAFFHTLRVLHEAGRDFSVVVRTFGILRGLKPLTCITCQPPQPNPCIQT